MKLTNVEKKENNQVELSIEVEKDEFEAAVQESYKKNVKNINVPGFRKGKAPRHMIEKLYGAEVFYEDAMDISYVKAYEKAVIEAGIQPIAQPSVTDLDIKDGVFTFKAIVMVKPELTVKAYKGLEAEKINVEITDEMVDNQIAEMAKRNSRQVAVEREAKNGDVVVFDFEGFVDGVAFDGGKAEKYSLTLGSGAFIPGFEDQIVGHKIDEEFDVNVTFPEEYQEKSLQGKPAVFKCKIHEIKEVQLPELDDEFAKDVSEFDTFEEYRNDMKKKMEEDAAARSEGAFTDAIMTKLAENLEGEVPEVMIENQISSTIENYDNYLRAQGLSFEQYVKMMGFDSESAARNMFREQAETQVKIRLALEAVAKAENLIPTDEDVEKEFQSYADQYKLPIEKIRELLAPVSVKSDLAAEKAAQFVKDNAKAKAPAKKRKTAAKKTTKKAAAEKEEAAEKTTEKAEDKE